VVAWPSLAVLWLILASGLVIAASEDDAAGSVGPDRATVVPGDGARPISADAAIEDDPGEGYPGEALAPPAELMLPQAPPAEADTLIDETATDDTADEEEGPPEPAAAAREDDVDGAPAASEAEVPPAVVAEPAAAPAEVTVRSGLHPTFVRFVFDWPEAVAFTVEPAADEAVISFARPARFAPDASVSADRLVVLGPDTVRMRVPGTVRVRSFALEDHRVVVDLYREEPQARPAEPVTPATGATAEPGLNGDSATAAAGAPAAATGAGDPDSLVPLGLLQSELYRRDLMIASLLARLEAVERGGPGSRGAALPPPPTLLNGVTQAAADDAVDGAMAADAGPSGAENPNDVERALERTLTRAGALLLSPGQMEIEPALSYTRRETSSPVFVSTGDAGVVFIGEDEVERDEVQASLDVKFGLPFDSQLEVSLPYNYVDQSVKTMVAGQAGAAEDGNGQALGNPRIGLAKTLVRETGWWPDIVARGYWDTDLGNATDNDIPLTGNFNELGGSVSAVKRQDPLAFVGAVGYSTVLEKNDIEPGDTWSFSAAAVLAASPATSLRLGFTQQFSDEVKVDGDKLDGSDSTSGVLTIGASAVLGQRALVDVALDVGLTDDAPDYAVRLAVPLRFDIPLPRPGRRVPASDPAP
jgi:hypothetical protein